MRRLIKCVVCIILVTCLAGCQAQSRFAKLPSNYSIMEDALGKPWQKLANQLEYSEEDLKNGLEGNLLDYYAIFPDKTEYLGHQWLVVLNHNNLSEQPDEILKFCYVLYYESDDIVSRVTKAVEDVFSIRDSMISNFGEPAPRVFSLQATSTEEYVELFSNQPRGAADYWQQSEGFGAWVIDNNTKMGLYFDTTPDWSAISLVFEPVSEPD